MRTLTTVKGHMGILRVIYSVASTLNVIPACPESKMSMIPDPRQARTGSAGMTIQTPRHYKVDTDNRLFRNKYVTYNLEEA